MTTTWSDPALALRLDDILYAAVALVDAAAEDEDTWRASIELRALARALDALPLVERERYGV